jgi:hypothetical protein
VLPGIPHHVTQRGNGRRRTFFGDCDYAHYLSLLRHSCRKNGTLAAAVGKGTLGRVFTPPWDLAAQAAVRAFHARPWISPQGRDFDFAPHVAAPRPRGKRAPFTLCLSI